MKNDISTQAKIPVFAGITKNWIPAFHLRQGFGGLVAGMTIVLAASTALAAPKAAAPKTAEISPPASSGEFFFKPYVGADYQYVVVNYDDIPGTAFNYGDIAEDTLHGANIHVGARVHKHLGFELGYLWTDSADKTLPGGSTSVEFSGFTLDAMGYAPLTDKVELIGTVGVAHLKGEATGTVTGVGTASADETETMPRIGVGAQVWLTENINARGLVRYQAADFDGTLKDMVMASAGLNFQF